MVEWFKTLDWNTILASWGISGITIFALVPIYYK